MGPNQSSKSLSTFSGLSFKKYILALFPFFFRKFHGERPADKNTIIKHGDVIELVKRENRKKVGGYWQSLKKIQIIQVEKESAKQYEAHVRFAFDNSGNINHMEPPAPAA